MTEAGRAQRLHWDLFIRKRQSATSGLPPGLEGLSWVANTATLLWGEQDAVLVDTFLSDAQTTELADWIEAKGKALTTIYLTHAHPDHFFGLTSLLERYPQARAVARPNVVAAMWVTSSPAVLEGNWKRRFPGLVPDRLTVAQALDKGRFELEGQELRILDLPHTDTDDTTALHVPALGLLIAGDAVYNETHPFLVETDRAGRKAWLAALDRLASLGPRHVVVGHGPLHPDNSPSHIQATRQYILDFDRLDGQTKTPRELYDAMLALYPHRINPGSLWGSAHAAKAQV
ncbi:MBL fold metallo-hydrolase [Roseomonas indoligenes]|uniref:MBL fold metallo-hydrolase n=1 Tax=Roseomonas indoligenes TaxID=2820811 RepID=A0A940S9G4_9PROT|nr:MBL fold metallo-hydrolase [Pararoseomonas indoligenes]MBP0495132.1 MBL fold metallo-hydrolase [Pararoseomonas indoligenes]